MAALGLCFKHNSDDLTVVVQKYALNKELFVLKGFMKNVKQIKFKTKDTMII